MVNDKYTLGLGFNKQYNAEAGKRITALAVKYGVTGNEGAEFHFEDEDSQASFLAEIANLPFIDTIIFPNKEVPRTTLEQLAKMYVKTAQGETQ